MGEVTWEEDWIGNGTASNSWGGVGTQRFYRKGAYSLITGRISDHVQM